MLVTWAGTVEIKWYQALPSHGMEEAMGGLS